MFYCRFKRPGFLTIVLRESICVSLFFFSNIYSIKVVNLLVLLLLFTCVCLPLSSWLLMKKDEEIDGVDELACTRSGWTNSRSLDIVSYE